MKRLLDSEMMLEQVKSCKFPWKPHDDDDDDYDKNRIIVPQPEYNVYF